MNQHASSSSPTTLVFGVFGQTALYGLGLGLVVSSLYGFLIAMMFGSVIGGIIGSVVGLMLGGIIVFPLAFCFGFMQSFIVVIFLAGLRLRRVYHALSVLSAALCVPWAVYQGLAFTDLNALPLGFTTGLVPPTVIEWWPVIASGIGATLIAHGTALWAIQQHTGDSGNSTASSRPALDMRNGHIHRPLPWLPHRPPRR